MTKILFLFALAISIALISRPKSSSQNRISGKDEKQAAQIDFKSTEKSESLRSQADSETSMGRNEPATSPGILHMLYNGTGHSGWTPALWWNYQKAGNGKPGC